MMRRVLANLVHAYTASGVIFALLAMWEVAQLVTDPRWVFLWLGIAVLIDATDGPLARAVHIKTSAPGTDGRKIDDILDYLTFVFVPLVLVWRMGWVPEPGWVFVGPAMIASLFGFANVSAKEEDAGFFRGFPSYWNLWAVYAGIVAASVGWGPWFNGVTVWALAVLTVLPVRFVYPNLAPRPWRVPVLAGAAVWAVLVLMMMPAYPRPARWIVWASLVYVAFYAGVSVYLDAKARRGQRH